jgi:hypothetical protein
MAKSTRTKPQDAEAAITVRFPGALVKRIDKQLQREQERRPGMKTSRADMIRTLLFEALEAREAAEEK